jgi:hypothetical protein
MNRIKSYCKITSGRVLLNGKSYHEYTDNEFSIHNFLASVYNRLGIEYRKFYKMDSLSKTGFLGSEILLREYDRDVPKENFGIILFNGSASLNADKKYQETISDKDNFFPSPSDFVYTLPNIVTGEISIRNKIFGETVFYVIPEFREELIYKIVDETLNFSGMNFILAGWIEVDDTHNTLDCLMMLCENSATEENYEPESLFLPANIKKLYTNN